MQENTKENYSINLRIIEVLDYYKISRYKLSQETGISEAVLLNIYKGNNKPSCDFLEKFILKYNQKINTSWLITGEGDMFGTNTINNNECHNCEELNKRLVDKDRLIRTLEELVTSKNTIIDQLINQGDNGKKSNGVTFLRIV
jgi:hypothetical protein